MENRRQNVVMENAYGNILLSTGLRSRPIPFDPIHNSVLYADDTNWIITDTDSEKNRDRHKQLNLMVFCNPGKIKILKNLLFLQSQVLMTIICHKRVFSGLGD